MPLVRALGFALLLLPGLAAHALAAAPPDSLAEVRRQYLTGHAADPAVAALAERVAARHEAAARRRPAPAAEALEWLGRVRLARAEYPAADTAFQRALALRRAVRPSDAHASAVTLGWLAEAQRATKQLARAESTAVAALAALAAVTPRDTSAEVRTHVTLGNIFGERGHSDRALAELGAAVELQSRSPRTDSLQLGQTLRNLGRARIVEGDLRGALADLDRAVAVLERALGPVNTELATTYLFAAMASAALGDGVAARPAAERAFALRERIFGPRHPVVAIALSTLGNAYQLLGEPRTAIPLYERAVEIQRAASRPSPFDLALALSNLGNACLAAGDPGRARGFLLEARDVRERAFGAGAGTGIYSRTRLAEALLLLGQPDSAAAELEPGLAALPADAGASAALDRGDAFGVRGRIEWARGRRREAITALSEAATQYEAVTGEASSFTLRTLALRAAARAESGERAGALADAQRIEAASRELLAQSARSLAEHEALAIEQRRASGLDVWLALATDSLGLDAAARARLADAVVRARLLVLDQLAEERRALPRDEPALAAAADELEAARDALAAALVDALRRDRAPDSAAVRARARREAAERALAERSERFAVRLRRTRAGLSEVLAALPPDAVLVSYVRHRPPAAVFDERRPAPARYTALVTRAGPAPPEVVPVAGAARLEAAVGRWLEACATPPPADVARARAAERRCDALGRAVSALAWAPLAPHLAGARRVFVVPDGVLHAVNFQALPAARGGRLVESGPLIHRLTAERDLLPWPGESLGRGLLVMGGPDFERAADAAGPSGLAAVRAAGAQPRLRFTPLPQTAAEVEEIAALWRSSAAPDAGEVLVRTGAAATEAAFVDGAGGRRVLHLAAHGFALGDTAVAAGPTDRRGVGAVVTGSASPAPRPAPLLPGLAFAGANAPAEPGGEDGFLTTEEITSLDLAGTEWAVLSACETGRSDPDAAEAVQGLQRAFRRAGARTVVMSLWAVDDAATREWMRRLYEARLLRGLDTAASATAACREWLAARRARGLDTHPFHWAAFVAAGDWR